MAFDVQVKELARGRWAQILSSLGLDQKFLSARHTSCPICGGKDRFRWDNRDGTGSYFCNQCGSGDGFMLAQKVTGKAFKDIAQAIRDAFSVPETHQATTNKRTSDNSIAIAKQWDRAGSPKEGGPLHTYQTKRFGRHWASNAIREASRVYNEEAQDYFFAQVARIVDPDGNLANVHITYLTETGDKAPVALEKRVMAGKLPEGCAIRIWPSAKVMGIAEGIETAISAAVIHKMPVWAAVNGAMLSKWIPPEVAQTVYVFGDNDFNFTGQAKAYALANRLVTQFNRSVKVKIPPETGWDWNDVLVNQMQEVSAV